MVWHGLAGGASGPLHQREVCVINVNIDFSLCVKLLLLHFRFNGKLKRLCGSVALLV